MNYNQLLSALYKVQRDLYFIMKRTFVVVLGFVICLTITGCGMTKDEAIEDIKKQEGPALDLGYGVTRCKVNGTTYSCKQALESLKSGIAMEEKFIQHLKDNMSDYQDLKDPKIVAFAYDTLWCNEVFLGEYKTWEKSVQLLKTVGPKYVSNRKLWYNPKYQYAFVDKLALKNTFNNCGHRPLWSINPSTPWSRGYHVENNDGTYFIGVSECTFEYRDGSTIISPVLRIKNTSNKPISMLTPYFNLVICGNEYEKDDYSDNYYFVSLRAFTPYAENEQKWSLNPNEQKFIYDYTFTLPFHLTKYDEIYLKFYSSPIVTKNNNILISADPRYRQTYTVKRSRKTLSNQYDVEKPTYKTYVPKEFLLNDKEFPAISEGKGLKKLYLSLPSLQVLNFNFKPGYSYYDFHSSFSVINEMGYIHTYNVVFEYSPETGELVNVLNLNELDMPGVAELLNIDKRPWLKNVGAIIRDIYQFEKLSKK